MKLTKKDKEILYTWGYSENDIEQIEKVIRKTDYKLGKEKITCVQAKKLLGTTEFLSGISRSAFHWSAIRYIKNGKDFVDFDSSNFLKKKVGL